MKKFYNNSVLIAICFCLIVFFCTIKINGISIYDKFYSYIGNCKIYDQEREGIQDGIANSTQNGGGNPTQNGEVNPAQNGMKNNEVNQEQNEMKDKEINQEKNKIKNKEINQNEMEITEIGKTEGVADNILEAENQFYWSELSGEIKDKITGRSYPSDDADVQICYDDLAYVHVIHYNFDDEICDGEIICNKKIADDLVVIFKELYENKYQIEKIRLIDDYNADDLESMADNNSSAFNYRFISGTTKLSNHSFGAAIDINPLYNPYVFYRNERHQVQPYNAEDYVDRDKNFNHKIDHNDLCYKLFIRHGFTWGGDWNSSKDYQHFEKKL